MVKSVKSQPNHYKTLGLHPTASDDDIAAAFAIESRKIIENPRVNEPDVREQARKIREAHQTLGDPHKRRAHDAALGIAVEPETHRAEAAFERSATPFMAAPERKQAKQRARQNTGDLHSQVPLKKGSRPAGPSDQQAREAASDTVKRNEGISRRERQRTKAQAEPVVGPFMATGGAGPVNGGGRETPPSDPPRPKPQLRPDGLSEPRTGRHASREERLGVSGAGDSNPERDEARTRLSRSPLIAGAVVAVIALFALLMWPLAGGVDRPSSTPRGQTAASVGDPATASSAISKAPSQQASPAQFSSQIAGEADGSSIGRSTASSNDPGTTSVAAAASSAPPAAATSPRSVELQPAVQDGIGDTAVAREPAPAPLEAAGAKSTAAAGAPAVDGEATRTAPAPTVNRETPAKLVSGSLIKSDNPRGRYQGKVVVQFTVGPNGRVTGCKTAASSGNPVLDSLTCQLVEQRLRFSPALDAQGRPMASDMHATYTWGRRHRSITATLLNLVRKLRP